MKELMTELKRVFQESVIVQILLAVLVVFNTPIEVLMGLIALLGLGLWIFMLIVDIKG